MKASHKYMQGLPACEMQPFGLRKKTNMSNHIYGQGLQRNGVVLSIIQKQLTNRSGSTSSIVNAVDYSISNLGYDKVRFTMIKIRCSWLGANSESQQLRNMMSRDVSC